MKFSLRITRWIGRAGLVLSMMLATTFASAQTITYFINDPFGNPVAATDAAGNVLWKENYRPFGERLNNPAAEADNKIGFAGKPYDPSTGLSYMGARYYDPVIGRFTGIDPVGFNPNDIHSFNRYAYGNNNPYRFDDPDGRMALPMLGLGITFGVIAYALAPPDQQRAMAASLRRAIDYVMRSDSAESNQAASGANGGGKASPSDPKGSTNGQKTVEDLTGESEKGRATKGRADQYINGGGREQRDKDFDSLGATDIKDRGNGTKTGTLPDGRPVNVHDSRTDGVPTIQIGNGNREIKIRYP